MFYVILKGRNAFLDYINKKLENSKNWIFPKGLVHGFGQKLVIFPDFKFWLNRPEKCVLRYSKRKKRLSRLYKQEVEKVEKLDFCKVVVNGFGQKLVIFPDFYFRENRPEKCVLNHKNVLYVILKGRNASLDYINKKLRKLKNWDFSKGVCPWFWSKTGNFSRFFFFREYRPEKCVFRYSRRKKRLSRL